MRAAVVSGPHTIELVDLDPPEPAAGQVLVRIGGSGICGSNLPVWEGRPWFRYPLAPGAPGHEGWGRVERVGTGVNGIEPGEPVALLSHHAFAEFDLTFASDVVQLPPSLANRVFPGEALACAVNVVRRARLQPGVPVAVVGVGFLGAAIVSLAVRARASVTALTRRRTACDLAIDLGARHAVEMTDAEAATARARAVNGGHDYPIVFEVTGLQGALDVASQLTATRGTLVIAGYHQDGARRIDLQSWNWRGLDVVNAHERDSAVYVSGLQQAVALSAGGALPLDKLVTHVFPLHELGDAFRHSVERPSGFLKAVVVNA